uniref:Uncharacterized protein n=1 Tax=Romanomermis culicivorax TaxID=13658 RepID=A0A915IZ49_ROMCU
MGTASAAHPRGIGTPFRSDNSILPRATVVVAMSKQKLSPSLSKSHFFRPCGQGQRRCVRERHAHEAPADGAQRIPAGDAVMTTQPTPDSLAFLIAKSMQKLPTTGPNKFCPSTQAVDAFSFRMTGVPRPLQ